METVSFPLVPIQASCRGKVAFDVSDDLFFTSIVEYYIVMLGYFGCFESVPFLLSIIGRESLIYFLCFRAPLRSIMP
jgi:hypothetical protein